MLSDLQNLEKVKERYDNPDNDDNEMTAKAKEALQTMTFDHDSLSVEAPMVGSITLNVVEREAPKTIKFESAAGPVPFNFWIQLLPVTEETCKMKLTLKAELNFFIKGMLQQPLQEGIEKMADVLQAIDYSRS